MTYQTQRSCNKDPRVGLSAGLGHVVAKTGDADDQAFFSQEAERFGHRLPRKAMLLRQSGDRRGRLARRELARFDFLAEQGGEPDISARVFHLIMLTRPSAAMIIRRRVLSTLVEYHRPRPG